MQTTYDYISSYSSIFQENINKQNIKTITMAPIKQMKTFVNRRHLTTDLRMSPDSIKANLAKQCYKRVICAGAGMMWTRRTFDRGLFIALFQEKVEELYGTSDIMNLLYQLERGERLEPLAINWIDSTLNRHFVRYLNRIDCSRFPRMMTALHFPSKTIEYFFLKAKNRYYRDMGSIGYYNECLNRLYTHNVYNDLPIEECNCHDDTLFTDVITRCNDHSAIHVVRYKPRIWDDRTRLVDVHEPPPEIPPRSPGLLARLRMIIERLMHIRFGWYSQYDRIPSVEIEMENMTRPTPQVEEFVKPEYCYDYDIVPQMMEPTEITGEEKTAVVLTNSEDCKETPAILEPPETFWAKASTSDVMVDNSHASQFEILAKTFTWNSSNTNGTILAEIDLPVKVIADNPDHPAAMQFQQYAYWIGSMRARLHVNTTPMHVGKLVMFFYYSAKYDINYANRFNIGNAVQFPHTFYNASSGEDACLDIPYRNFRSFLCTRKREADKNAFYMGTLVIMVFNSLDTASDIRNVDGYLHISFHNNQYSGILKRAVVEAQMLPIAATLKAAEASLNIVNGALNMDKPIVTPVPTFMQPTLTSSLASGVRDLSTINHMRLDPHGQTQHPAGSSTRLSETSIDTLKMIPGLLTQTAWNTSNSRGFQIWTIPATLAQPEQNYLHVDMTVEKQNFRGLVLPPVCYLADMHAFSRGAFSIIVEIVNSRFHTGALLIAYTPAVSTQTFEDAIQSYNMTLDCGSVNRYEFVVPYISERPLAARYNRFDSDTRTSVQSNGTIGLYVLNSLRSTSSATTVAVNIFMRGTDETEYMCLTAPNFSVIYDKVDNKFPELAIVPEAMGAIGLGTWRYADDIIKNMAVVRYGAGSDHVLQFPGLKAFHVYESNFQNAAANLAPLFAQTITRAGTVSTTTVSAGIAPQFIVRFICNGDGDKYYYAAGFPSQAIAIQYARKHYELRTASKPYPDSPRLSDFSSLLDTAIICLGYTTAPESYREYGNAQDLQYVSVWDAFTDVEAQMDNPIRFSEESQTMKGRVGIKKLLPLDRGEKLFGEKYRDLKDYARRYDLYAKFQITGNPNNLRVARIPVLSNGLKPDGVTAANREGLIPYINANYAFWRGSLQFKIFMEVPTTTSVTYYFQHKYDFHTVSRQVDTTPVSKDKFILTDTMQNGYAVAAICPQLNPHITIEVPCYIATNLLLAQRTNPEKIIEVVNASLGVLDVFSMANLGAKVTMWYALGDDFEYSCYIGIPPVVPINLLKPTMLARPFLMDPFEFIEHCYDNTVVPNMPRFGEKVLLKGVERDYTSLSIQEATEYEEQQHMQDIVEDWDATMENMDNVLGRFGLPLVEEDEAEYSSAVEDSDVESLVDEVVNDAAQALEDNSVDDITPHIDSEGTENINDEINKRLVSGVTSGFLGKLRDKVRNAFRERAKRFTASSIREELDLEPAKDDVDTYTSIFKDIIKKVSKEYKHIIISVIGQICQYIANPCAITAVITITTLLSHLGFETGIFDKAITKVFNLFGNKDKVVANVAGENESEESPKLIKMNFVKALVAACATKLGATIDVIKAVPYIDFSKGIWSNVRFGALTFNTLVIMVKNIVEYVPKIFEWLARKINPVHWYRVLLAKDASAIDKWTQDVDFVLDPTNAQQIHTDPRMAVLLQFLVLVGKELAIKMSRLTTVSSKEFQCVRHRNIELNKLYTELVMSNSACGIVRAEPYCFCVHGESQVGKTHLATLVAENALRNAGWQGFILPTYTRQPGAPYWTGVMGQLICVVEDWLQFEESDKAWDDLYDVIHLVSCQVFQPPQAEISRKHIRFSPLIVVLTMNKAFKRIKGVADNNAWMNRRHDLFHFINTMGCSPKYMSKEVQDSRSYLVVKKHAYTAYKPPGHTQEIHDVENKYVNVKVPQFSAKGEIVLLNGKVVYEEVLEMNFWQFQWYVAEKFKIEYKRIIRQYQEALVRLTKFWPEDDSLITSKFEKYIKDINLNSPTLSEDDKKLLKTVADAKNKKLCTFCQHYEAQCTCKDLAILQSKLAKDTLKQMADKQVVPQMNVGAHAFFSSICSNWEGSIVEKQLTYQEKLTVFMNHLPNITKRLYGKIYENAAKYVLLDKDWRNSIPRLYACCPHEAMTLMDWQRGIYDVEFFEKHFEYNEHKIPYPNQACCKDTYDRNWTVLRSIESTQEACGILNHPIPILVEKEAYKLDTSFLKGKYKQFDEDFKKFVNAKVKPMPWMQKWGIALFDSCKVVLKIASILLSIFSVKFLYDKYKEGGTPAIKEQILETINMENKLRAKRIALHTPTKECLTNCPMNICGNMAYNQNKPVKQIPVIKTVRAEMAPDLRTNIENLIARNTFFLRATAREGEYRVQYDVRCLGLKGQYFIAIDHYFDKFMTLAPDTIFEYVQPNKVIEINYTKLGLRRLEKSCLVIGELPRQVPAFANIVNKICSEKHGANLPRDGMLYELKLGDKSFDKCIHKQDFIFVDREMTVPPVGHAVYSTNVRNYYQYSVGGLGMCGSVLVSDSNGVAPIVGIHFAGKRDGSEGYAEVISRETFELIFDELVDQPSVATEHVQCNNTPVQIDPQANPTAVLNGIYEHVGVVERPYAHRPPPNSKQEHSECYNQITISTYDFPLLSPKDPRAVGSPMVLGCQHHCNPPRNFEDDLLEEATHNVRTKILAHTKPKRLTVGVLTPEEVIVGIKNNDFYNALEFDTSEGFPFTRYRPKGAHDKRWLFDLETVEDGFILHGIDPMLIEVMENKHRERLANIIPLTVFTDCLKDIKVPAEKIQPRIFSISPVDFTIQFKQYFSDFMIAYQEARFKVSSAIGINVDSMEWTQMVNMLLNNSPHFGCGDYSKFGPRLMAICVFKAFDIMNDWYTLHGDEKNNYIRTIMAHEVAFSKHLMFNFVYGVLCGAPSGSPITTILNNIVNDIYINYVWCYVIRNLHTTVSYTMETTYFSYSSFSLFVMLICYGDDLIMTIKEEVLAIFNPIIIKEVLSLYDIKFTDACKTGTQYASLNVFDKAVSFLKRNIAVHPHRSSTFLAKMDKRAIEETCNWIHKTAKVREMSIVSCEAMLLNAFGHGKAYYENLRKRVQNFWINKHEVVNIPSWDEVDFRIFGRDDFIIKKFLW
uniref:Genome polyprotein n=1 Tax=Yonago Culex iflavirus TaxID=2683675 RepID=A0A6F8PYP2_9VIRU|nr:putative polyprotein [Yonago Culex iflavirus]